MTSKRDKLGRSDLEEKEHFYHQLYGQKLEKLPDYLSSSSA